MINEFSRDKRMGFNPSVKEEEREKDDPIFSQNDHIDYKHIKNTNYVNQVSIESNN